MDLLAVQGTLKSLFQHHSSKASILQCSAFFMVQLSHPYMTTGKTMTLTIRTFAGKVMSLLLDLENYCDVSTDSSCFPHTRYGILITLKPQITEVQPRLDPGYPRCDGVGEEGFIY